VVNLPAGRILRAQELPSELVPLEPAASDVGPPRGRIVSRTVVDAEQRARELVEQAERNAQELVLAATRESADIRLRAEAEGRADGAAALAAKAVAWAAHEARADERQLDRIVQIAQLLAERLLGEALGLDPTRVLALARQALTEARGARRITIVAHPDDARALEALLEEPVLKDAAVRVSADPQRKRGSLRLDTEIGSLDADLAPQLARLATRLREGLGR
jgi:flagellar biosynthesis/type III secretory pathway protein FliH